MASCSARSEVTLPSIATKMCLYIATFRSSLDSAAQIIAATNAPPDPRLDVLGSSESWEPQQAPHRWHSRAGGGAVQGIKSVPVETGHVRTVEFQLLDQGAANRLH